MSSNIQFDPNLKRSQQFDTDQVINHIEKFTDALKNNKMPEFRSEMEIKFNNALRENKQCDDISENLFGVTIKDQVIPGPNDNPEVPIRIYTPNNTTNYSLLPVLLYMHGGSYSTGSPKYSDSICASISKEVHCIIVSVQYRLAPEHKFPAAINDCYSVLQWLSNHAEQLHGDPNGIAVAGHSSGGNLAAALALMSRDKQGPKIVFQLLLSPSLDNRAYRKLTHRPKQFAEMGRVVWESYTGQTADETVSPYAVPARAEDLSNLPPSYSLVAELDFLRDAGIEYALRLTKAGVSSELHIFPDVDHMFDQQTQNESGIKAFSDYTSALKSVFNKLTE